ncbi:MAG: hypothetical protein KBG75_10435 [Pseudomonadales bacterium]|nr:hypothetical protein [Pseudomonadales bacterium]
MLALCMVLLPGACATLSPLTPEQAASRSDRSLCGEMRSLTESYTDTSRNGGYTNLEQVKLRLNVIAAELERRKVTCTEN